jgi:large subunit ribosomal protein L23
MQLNNSILKPLITEKGVLLSKENKYLFKVNMKATKHSIEKEVKRTFGVDVVDVKTIVVPGKKRRRSRTHVYIKTAKWKKAIVQLKEGQKIDLFPSE